MLAIFYYYGNIATMKEYQTGLMKAFVRSGAKSAGTSSNDLLEAILCERQDLREKMKRGELMAFVPAYGNTAHTVIIGDKNRNNAEIFKAPRIEDSVFYSFYEEADWFEKLRKAGQPVPEVTCRGKQSLFFGMKYVPGVPLVSVLDEMTKKELETLSTDIVNFIIGMANCEPKNNLVPHHKDLQETNILVDPVSKKLMVVLDFGLVKGERGVEYVPKLALGQTGLAKGRVLPASPDKSLMQMIREEYALRKDEVSETTPLVKHSNVLKVCL